MSFLTFLSHLNCNIELWPFHMEPNSPCALKMLNANKKNLSKAICLLNLLSAACTIWFLHYIWRFAGIALLESIFSFCIPALFWISSDQNFHSRIWCRCKTKLIRFKRSYIVQFLFSANKSLLLHQVHTIFDLNALWLEWSHFLHFALLVTLLPGRCPDTISLNQIPIDTRNHEKTRNESFWA